MMRKIRRRIRAEWERALFWAVLCAFTAVLLCLLSDFDVYGPVAPHGSVPLRESVLNSNSTAFLQPPPDVGRDASPFAFTIHLPAPVPAAVATPEPEPEPEPEPSPEPVVGMDAAISAVNTVSDGANSSTPASPPPPSTDGPVDADAGPSAPASPPAVGATPAAVPAPPAVVRPAAAAAGTEDGSSDEVATSDGVVAPVAAPAPVAAVRVVEYRGILTTATGKIVAFIKALDPSTQKVTYAYLTPDSETDGIRIRSFTRHELWVVDPHGQERRIPFGQKEQIAVD